MDIIKLPISDEMLMKALYFSETLKNLDERTALRMAYILAGLDSEIFLRLYNTAKSNGISQISNIKDKQLGLSK